MVNADGQRIEVRVLGGLRVRRADGSTVDSREWKTGKNADLLKLLALRNGRVLAVDTIIEALWPDVDDTKARASLRTAASQIRHVLGGDHLGRAYDGLALRSAWVDAQVFVQLARSVRRFCDERSWAEAVMTAREGDALYVGDVVAHNPGAQWLYGESQALRDLRLQLLLDAGAAAVELRWLRDAIDFARRALLVDPYSERAFRALMAAHAGLGETERALAAFEECRAVLAENLGADPSEQTRAVHLQVLTASPMLVPPAPFVGREDERAWLADTLRSHLRERTPGLITVTGASGIGKSTLVTQVVAGLTVPVVHRSCSGIGEPVVELLRRVSLRAPIVVVLDDVERLSTAEAAQVGHEVQRMQTPIVVVAILGSRALLNDGVFDEVNAAGRLDRLHLGLLTRAEVTDLAAAVLGGTPVRGLIDTLLDRGGGWPGRTVDVVRAWQATGVVVATATGLALMPSHGRAVDAAGRPRELEQMFDSLSTVLLRVLALVAVFGDRVSARTLALIDPEVSELQAGRLLRELADLSILELDRGSYRYRGPWLQADMIAWLRPAERQSLHRQVAERGPVTAVARIHHWLAAGEPQQACEVALAAPGDDATARGLDEAREQLLLVRDSIDVPGSDPTDRARLLERLGDVEAGLGRIGEARDAYRAGLVVATAHDLPEVKTLIAAQRRLEEDSDVAPVAYERCSAYVRELVDEMDWDRATLPSPAQEHRLRDALAMADQVGDIDRRMAYRLLLADAVLTPRRAFREARSMAEESVGLSGDPASRGLATAVLYRAGVLLGGSAFAYAPLESAWNEALHSGDADSRAQVGVLLCLAAHDLGRPRFDVIWHEVERLPLRSRRRAGWDWLSIRVHTERGDLRRAQMYASNGPVATIGPLGGQLEALARSTLEWQLHGPTAATETRLCDLLAAGQQLGCPLVNPEATALLAEITSTRDILTAEKHLDDVERWSGEVSLGRERCARLLALAAIRASTGRASAAAEIAHWVAETAQSLGLVFVQARALSAAARYELADQMPTAAAQSSAAAVALWQQAGAPAAAERGLAWAHSMALPPVEVAPPPDGPAIADAAAAAAESAGPLAR